MKKTLIFFLLLIIFVSGCTQSNISDGKDKDKKIELKEWADYINSNKSYECNVTLIQEEFYLNLKVYLKGKSIREEMIIEGSPVKIIFKNNKVYSFNEVNIDLRDESLKACDWIIYSIGETTEEIMNEQFYDISTFEEIGMAKYTCKEATFGDEKFDTTGNVCDVSAIMNDSDE
jgi:hypothetical protein